MDINWWFLWGFYVYTMYGCLLWEKAELGNEKHNQAKGWIGRARWPMLTRVGQRLMPKRAQVEGLEILPGIIKG